MKALVIYDSLYGHTEQIAKAIAKGIGAETGVVKAAKVKAADIAAADLLVIGSPTQAGRPMPDTKALIDKMSAGALKDKKVAAFDTRVKNFIARAFGWAADRIAKDLVKKGGGLVVPPEGFFVKGTKGPLLGEELERAADWGKSLAAK